MADTTERWELARIIDKTEHLFHHHYMRRLFAEVRPDFVPALTPSQVHMVMTVRQHGPITVKQLATSLHVKAPAVSAMVERLVELGVLTREKNPDDRREVQVRISPRDESQIREMERYHLQFAAHLVDRIGIKDARVWAGLCTRIQAVLTDGWEV